MRGYDFTAGRPFDACLPDAAAKGRSKLAVICDTGDIHGLVKTFGWDESTLDECTNLDETVRYTSYDGYDFISLIYAETEQETVSQREINVFFSKNLLALVLPERTGTRLTRLADDLTVVFPQAAGRANPLVYL
jgi:hypothetical protein